MSRENFGRIAGWEKPGDCWTSTASLGVVRRPSSRGYLAIRRPGLSGWSGGKKNGVRVLRDRTPEFLRQQDAACPGPLLRGCADVPGSDGAARLLSTVRQGETGAADLAGRQPVLHEAVCLVCGAAVSVHEHPGCGQGGASGLAYREGPREAVHGRVTPACWHPHAKGHRDR